jgi:hypothetical protein
MRIRDLQILTGLMAILSALCIIMAWLIGGQPYPDISTREVPKWQPTESFMPIGLTGPEKQLELSEAKTRPLFRQSRRPFDPVPAMVAEAVQEPAPQPPTPPPDASQLSVRGILIEGPSRQALIVTPEAPDGVWMTLGMDVMGWKITGLGPNGVTLKAGQQGIDLKLYVDNEAN